MIGVRRTSRQSLRMEVGNGSRLHDLLEDIVVSVSTCCSLTGAKQDSGGASFDGLTGYYQLPL